MTTAPHEDAAIFGRSDALATALAQLGRCLQVAAPTVFVVVGAPGIGKTRLVTEVVHRTELSPVRRLVGFEPERSVPFAGVAPLLHELSSNETDVGGRLSALLDSPDQQRDGLGALRLFEAASSALLASTPSLLVIDDLQWLDGMSRALVHHALRAARTDGSPLALLVAARGEAEAHAWVASVRSMFGADSGFAELELPPLDIDAGIALAQSRNRGLSRDAATEIWAGARGSPFWISLHAAGGQTAPEPRHALTSLLRMLSDDAARCLAAVVVFGRPIPVDALHRVLGWSCERAEAAVDELVRRGLAARSGDIVATAHDLVRETAAADVPAHERGRLHAAISEYLQATAQEDLAKLMEAVEHACAAGVDATALVHRILSSPRRRLVGVDGLERLAGIADAGAVDLPDRVRLVAELAELAEELGSHHSAATRFDWLSTVLPDRHDRAQAAFRAAQRAFELGDAARMRELLDRACAEAGDDEWTAVAIDALEFNRLVWLQHDAAAALPFRRRAIQQARRLVEAQGGGARLDRHRRAAYVQALDAERVGRLMDDDMDGLLEVTDELVAATRGMGERNLDARTLPSMALRFFNRWQESADRLVSVIAEAEQLVYPQVAAYATYELALATYHLGDLAAAREQHDKATRLGTRVDGLRQETMDTWLCGLRQLIDASRVDWRSAIDDLVAEGQAQTNAHCRVALEQRTAMLAARFDPAASHDLVVAQLTAANADAAVAECVRCKTEIEIVTAELLARVGEVRRARELVATWVAAHPDPKPRVRFFLDRAQALIAARGGDPAAPSLLAELAARAHQQGLGLDRVWALLDLGEAAATNDPERAIAALHEADATATTLGAASERALAKQRLRELGVRPATAGRARGDAPPFALSRRELEVARLAAHGARNAEIAATLFLSQKTVEQHLSRAFAKLGVRNRAELGARFAEQLG
jgi:DNA-binding CsgD family transcriptional regulator